MEVVLLLKTSYYLYCCSFHPCMNSDKYEGNTAPVHGKDGKLSAAFSEEQGFKLLKSEERYKKLAKREEVLHYSGILTSGTKRPPLFGMPSIFCHDTGEFLCAWCSKNALRPSDRKSLTKTAIPVVRARCHSFTHPFTLTSRNT